MTTIPLADRETAVYRLFDAAGTLLYVGVGWQPWSRFRDHSSSKDWWPKVDHKAIEWHDNRLTALHHEALAIQIEKPLHNKAHPSPKKIHAQRVVAMSPAQPRRANLPGMSLEQASKRLGVRASWLFKGVHAGELNHHCNEWDVWFTEDDLKHIIAKHAVLHRGAFTKQIREHERARRRAYLDLTRPGCRHTY